VTIHAQAPGYDQTMAARSGELTLEMKRVLPAAPEVVRRTDALYPLLSRTAPLRSHRLIAYRKVEAP
jgi:hypothetical protein